jgi:hypothetical protein
MNVCAIGRVIAASLVATCGTSVALAQGTLSADQTVLREGEGARRTALNGRERKPFPTAAWGQLSDWANGPALTATSIQDRPVLIVTWTDYLPAARRAVQTATRMSERFAKDGLIVVLVHPEKEWATAAKPASPQGATLLVAKDAKGEFRKTLDVDQDPDFYVIDRAGQLRFADVTLEAVERACEIVAKEGAKDASSLNDRLATERAAAEREARRTGAINSQATFTNIPALPFRQPSETEYANAEWPKLPLDEQKQQSNPGATLPARPITLPEEGWIPSKPNSKGKLVVAYLFHPRLSRFKDFNDMIPQMDLIQRQYARDVVVVGLLTVFEQANIPGVTFTDDDKNPEKLAETIKGYAKSRNFSHYLAPSFTSNVYLQAADQTQGGEYPIPAFVIIGTDGMGRWWSTPKGRVAFDAALQQMLRVDPGVQSRRKAEAEWLKNNPQAAQQNETPTPAPAAAPEGESKAPTTSGG